MSQKLLYKSYQFNGHQEPIVSIDAQNINAHNIDNHILFIPPLFAEMNKTRRTLIETMRLLGEQGVTSSLPDFPGCNESITKFDIQRLSSWREAMKACCTQYNITHIAAFRGGCLIDDISLKIPHFWLNAIEGHNIIKTMLRSKLIALKEAGEQTTIDALSQQAIQSGIELAGYYLNPSFFSELHNCRLPTLESLTSANLTNANLTSAKIGQDIEGAPLWLRSEPEHDEKMAQSLSDALLKWCTV